jgi:hypothetical protein
MEKLIYERTTYFLGRNGYFKQQGIDVFDTGYNIELRPITSKGLIGRSVLTIPKEEFGGFMKVLKTFEKNLR